MSRIPTVQPIRRGTVLIVVAGISALLATIALAFLLRMRADGEEVRLLIMQTQARLGLFAAAGYILEAGRIGWDNNADKPNQVHHETYGWIDVRDGFMGPKIEAYSSAVAAGRDPTTYASPNFPVGHIGRFPLEVWQRPPCALAMEQAPNAIKTEISNPSTPRSDPLYGKPYLINPDPTPVQSAGLPTGSANAAKFADWILGDRVLATATPTSSGAPIIRPESQGLGWFRIYRDGPATFVITVGGGATRGFKDWNEVVNGPWGDQSDLFGGRVFFDSLQSGEVRQWFRVEWSAAIGGIQPTRLGSQQTHGNYEYKSYKFQIQDGQRYASRGNACGTFNYFQRLRYPPVLW